MKLAIWSDCHIGRRQYRTDENNINKYEQEGYRVANEYADVMIKENPDLIICAGDVFDTPNPSVLAMNKYAKVQMKFDRAGIPTMDILGNHDFSFPNRRSKCSAAAMASHTYFADYDIKTVEINDILFIMMPYIYDTDENITNYMKVFTYVSVLNFMSCGLTMYILLKDIYGHRMLFPEMILRISSMAV